MTQPIRGSRLQVPLSASEVRRRLRGRGFGVRRVETAGENAAVVVHTATGEHLRELEAVLREPVPVDALRNLGPVSREWLGEVGVHSLSDLQRLGPVATFRLVKQRRPRASLNLLWALAGALQGCDWRRLSKSKRRALLDELED